MNYINEKCIVCNKKFKDGDDIVVCPECGTPYHRDCYNKEGKCVNTELHEKNEAWKPAAEREIDNALPKDKIVCEFCGHENPPLALFCDNCGFPLSSLEKHNENMRVKKEWQNNGNPDGRAGERPSEPSAFDVTIHPFIINFSNLLCGLNPEGDYGGVRLCERADYVENNTQYYLPIFKRIKDTGRSLSWNFAAMLFPEFYFCNRKMPLVALGVFLVRAAAYFPYILRQMALLNESFAGMVDFRSTAFQVIVIICNALFYSLMFVCGAFANSIYYKKAVKAAAKIKRSVPPQTLRQTLRAKGGTSVALLTISIVIAVLIMFILPTAVLMFGM